MRNGTPGELLEMRTRFAIERASDRWWRRFWRRHRLRDLFVCLTGAAALVASALASVSLYYATVTYTESVRRATLADQLRIAQIRHSMEWRMCRQYPKWCEAQGLPVPPRPGLVLVR